jgi:pilus assembly protein FimV
MIITCDDCNSSFNIGDGMIKDSGSKVRCSKCDNVFMAYPPKLAETAALETSVDDLSLESDEQMPGEDEDLGLDDLDSSFSDFLSEDDEDEDETLAASSEIDEAELDLDDFGETLDEKPLLEPEEVLDEPSGELELDLDFDQDEDPDLEFTEDTLDGDDLPDLGDFEDVNGLDDEKLTPEPADSQLDDLELELEGESNLESDEKELDLTDLGLEEEGASAMEEPASDNSGDLDLKLDLELDSATQNNQETTQADLKSELSDELDLSDLELALEDEAVPASANGTDSADLKIDPETADQVDDIIAEAGLELEEAEDLDMADLDLEMDDADLGQDTSASGADDLGLDLEAETIADNEGGGAGQPKTGADELDLSDLSNIMEEEQAPAAETEPEELDLEMALGAEASDDEGAPAAAAASEDIDELDLSDLSDFLENEDVPAASQDTTQDLEMDLDFQIDEGASAADTAGAAVEDGATLDFSDLEQMLESDETPSVEAAGVTDVEELDIQFDLDEPSNDTAAVAAAGKESEAAQTDDFLDIEQMLESGEATTSPDFSEMGGEETELPLEMEAALDDASKGSNAELELDFDLESELQEKEDLFDSGSSQLESDLQESDEVDFLEDPDIEETVFQDGSNTSVIGTDDLASDNFSATNDAYGATHVLPGSDEEPFTDEGFEQMPVQRKAPKARSKKPVLAILLLLILAAGVIIVPNMLGIKIPYISDLKIPYLSDLDLKIPYLSDWLNPEQQDVAGNLNIIPLGNTIKGKFINNSQSGQLFVIEGSLKNDYDHPRSHIKVTGKLYQKGNKIAKKATVYCGNVLADSDLAKMDIGSIKKLLLNPEGSKKSNLKVKTGKMVPFMIVFDNLPRNLDEYSVEVEGSSI